ncbi:hypothetical protein [Zavarzinia aquatilis]|uniref:Uncharacterized protein n=1 Tax=Zavarzinia aquatilis TaxID=2211142 RepID=A0A317EIR7_9PROT|nr:hypothetical protein [Zavarzinia aquatilis]PWR25135.1 hypothetical protein DKG74_05055 [Zavarzinia aquatilis]
MSRLLARGVAGASWAFLSLLALSLAASGLWPWPVAAVFVAFALVLDLVTIRHYARTRVMLRLQRRGDGQRYTELAAALFITLLFFALAFIQGAGPSIGGVDPRLLAALALMFGLFLARLCFGGARAKAGYERIGFDAVTPFDEVAVQTKYGFLAFLLLSPLLILPARLQRASFNLIGYGLGFAAAHAAFRLIATGKPGLETLGLIGAYVAALALCAVLIPVFGRHPLLRAEGRSSD